MASMRGDRAASPDNNPDNKESAMLLTKSRVLIPALSVAGLAGAVALGFGTPYLGDAFRSAPAVHAAADPAPADNGPLLVAEKTDTEPADRTVRVDAPSTRVDVDKERGKVRVDAPHTQVRVDPDQGRVRVRAPYVNLDIRW
jgi:hypothetical protein